MNCPLPAPSGDTVTLAHGGGGRLTNRLIEDVMIPAFGRPPGGEQHDGALLPLQGDSGIAFTTDCHVVDPLFFPGGDIGSLSIIGTVNDLAMCGALPKWISAGFILEEGLSMSVLRRVVASMATHMTPRCCDQMTRFMTPRKASRQAQKMRLGDSSRDLR